MHHIWYTEGTAFHLQENQLHPCKTEDHYHTQRVQRKLKEANMNNDDDNDESQARTSASAAADGVEICLSMPVQTQRLNVNQAWNELKRIGKSREQIAVNPLMLFVLMPKKLHDDDFKTIELLRTDTNHNTLIGTSAYEIANNITNDPIEIDVKELKERSFGYGIDLTATFFPPVSFIPRQIFTEFSVPHCASNLLVLQIRKGEQHTIEGRDQSAVPLKPFSRHDTRSGFYSAVRPPKKNMNDFDGAEDWFGRWLEKGGAQILQANPLKERERREIADHFGMKQEWERDESRLMTKACDCERFWAFVRCVTRHRKQNYVALDPSEGIQRLGGIIIASTGKFLDCDTGELKSRNVTISDFLRQKELKSKNDKIDGSKDLQPEMSKALVDKNNTMLYNENQEPRLLHVKIYSVTKKGATGDAIRNLRKTTSYAVSVDKHESSFSNPFITLGTAIKDLSIYCVDSNPQSILNNPDYDREKQCEKPKMTLSLQKKEWKAVRAKDEFRDVDLKLVQKEAFKYCDIIDSEIYQKYVRAFFDGDKIEAVRGMLETPVATESDHSSDRKIAPFHIPTWKSLSVLPHTANDPSGTIRLTTENKNNLLLIPQMVGCLEATRKGGRVQQPTEDPEVIETVDYMVKHHVHCNNDVPSSIDIHHSMEVVYGKKRERKSSYTCARPHHLIGAIQLLLAAFNAILSNDCDDFNVSEDEAKEKFEKAIAKFVFFMSKIEARDQTAIEEALETLGEMGINRFLFALSLHKFL